MSPRALWRSTTARAFCSRSLALSGRVLCAEVRYGGGDPLTWLWRSSVNVPPPRPACNQRSLSGCESDRDHATFCDLFHRTLWRQSSYPGRIRGCRKHRSGCMNLSQNLVRCNGTATGILGHSMKSRGMTI